MLKRRTMGIIFANMHGGSVASMTELRSLGALPFGGRYRLIDFPLTAFSRAGITQVGVIVKESYHSLMDHIGTGRDWDLSRKNSGVSVFPPFSEAGTGHEVYHGRVEALNSVINYINESRAEYVVMMDCDYVCNFDFEEIVNAHIDSAADVTLVCCDLPHDEEMLKNTVSVYADGDGWITDIGKNEICNGDACYSMNVFVASKKKMMQYTLEAKAKGKTHFEFEALTPKLGEIKARRHKYEGFVKRIYSPKSYFDASMSLLCAENLATLFHRGGPVFTKIYDEAPVRYGLDATVINTIAADGCVIEGDVENCVLFRGVNIRPGARVRNSILMQNTVVLPGAKLDYVITDKEVEIGENHEISGTASEPKYIRKQSRV